MSLRSLMHKGRAASRRLACGLLAVAILVALAAVFAGVVPLQSLFTYAKPTTEQGLGAWWLRSLTVSLACYVFTSIAAVVIGALVGGLTSKRDARLFRPSWYNGAIRRGLELTGALPSVIFCAIWLSSHPGQALPALMIITLVQQVFEVGARVKSMIESPNSTWNALWCELTTSASQVAVTLASGEIALIVLGLTPANYATWASSAASYLCDTNPNEAPSVLGLALVGTLVFPACLFLAGSARPTPH
jgi:hypothetical protein